MKKYFVTLMALCGLMFISATSWALSITPDTTPKWTGTYNANLDAADVAAIVGSSSLSSLYKCNVGQPDVWTYAASYQTVYSNTSTDPEDATITYVTGQAAISSNPLYLLVKDGNNAPYWYLFDLVALGWNGTETIYLTSFWPSRGAISHVAMFGVPVPEPAALILLGLGLLGIAGVRRKK